MNYWLELHQVALQTEYAQCLDEGRDLSSVTGEFEQLMKLDLKEKQNHQRALAWFDSVSTLPYRENYPYVEPSDLEGIRAARPSHRPDLPALSLDDSGVQEKLHGAWLGRCIGCLLGKPVEGWDREKMWGYLKAMDRWPLNDFFRYTITPPELREKYSMDTYYTHGTYVDQVTELPEDDDTNYTVIALALLKRYGFQFTPLQVAEFWMDNLAVNHTATAECIAYRNFCMEILPPESALYHNPYREWIGAQIRADFWGYMAAGDPTFAAELAWRDACTTHVKNGIYGAMWVAAMIAASFVTNDRKLILQAGLGEIPARSRLAERIQQVIDWYDEGISYDTAVTRLHTLWDEHRQHDAVHTISNAMIVTIALLWGEGDYGLSICRAVQPCFDTDCNGATVGSLVGTLLGRSALPGAWVNVVHDVLQTGVAGYTRVSIPDLVQASLALRLTR